MKRLLFSILGLGLITVLLLACVAAPEQKASHPERSLDPVERVITLGVGIFSRFLDSMNEATKQIGDLFIGPKRAPARIKIISSSAEDTPPNRWGWAQYRVSGRVKNTGGTPAGNVKVIAIFYNEKGEIVGAGQAFAEESVLEPGEETVFIIKYQYWNESERPRSHSLKVDFISPPPTSERSGNVYRQ